MHRSLKEMIARFEISVVERDILREILDNWNDGVLLCGLLDLSSLGTTMRNTPLVRVILLGE